MAGRLTAPPRPPRRAEDIWAEEPTPANGSQPPRIPGTYITPDMSLAEMSVLGLLSGAPQGEQSSGGQGGTPPPPPPGYTFINQPFWGTNYDGSMGWQGLNRDNLVPLPTPSAPRYSPQQEADAALWLAQQKQGMEPSIDIPGYGAIPTSALGGLAALIGQTRPEPAGLPYSTEPPPAPAGFEPGSVTYAGKPGGGYAPSYTYQAPPRISPFQQASLEEETRASKASESLQAERQRGYRQVTPQELAAYYNMLQQLRTFYRS